MLEKYGIPLYEEQLVEHLLDQIMSPNTELNTEVKICRSSHLSTFFKTSTYLSTVVAGGSCAHENGIYISDFTRYSEDSEWAALSNDTSKRIT